MKRAWLPGVFVVALMAVSDASAWAQGDLGATIAALVAEPAVARAHWGVMVTAMDGTPIYEMNEAKLFQPASNVKLFTTAAALHLLGEGRRFSTVLEGPPGSGGGGKTLEGDLTLHGSGDANLSGREVPYAGPGRAGGRADPLRYLAEMADAVVAAGVRHVTGDVVGDDTIFPWEPYPNEWAADDLVWGYGAPVSALTVTDNQMSLKLQPGAGAGADAVVTLYPPVPYYSLETSVQTVAAKTPASVEIERALGSKVLRVSGTIAAGSGTYAEEVAIQDPAEFAAVALKGMLEARGVKIDGRPRAVHRMPLAAGSFLHDAKEPLPSLPKVALGPISRLVTGKGTCFDACPLRIEHTSPTVLEDVVVTNKESQNLHAELLLHHLGLQDGTDGSTAQGARVIWQFLVNAGVDPGDFAFYDGSGLSGHDLVTPRAVAKLLQYASTQPWFVDYKGSLPVGGVDGTLEHRFTALPLKGHVFAKTGTNSESRALSGYLECASGRTVIFSVIVGNHAPGTSADRDVMDRIVAAIAAVE